MVYVAARSSLLLLINSSQLSLLQSMTRWNCSAATADQRSGERRWRSGNEVGVLEHQIDGVEFRAAELEDRVSDVGTNLANLPDSTKQIEETEQWVSGL